MIHILKLLFVLQYHMFNFKVEKASGYILKTFSFFLFSCLYFTFFVSIVMFLTAYVAAHREGGKYSQISQKIQKMAVYKFYFHLDC